VEEIQNPLHPQRETTAVPTVYPTLQRQMLRDIFWAIAQVCEDIMVRRVLGTEQGSATEWKQEMENKLDSLLDKYGSHDTN